MGDNDRFLKVEFFDDDEESETHTLAFLHLLVVILDAVDKLFAALFVSQAGHMPQVGKLETELRARAESIAGKQELYHRVLVDLGLWDVRKPAA